MKKATHTPGPWQWRDGNLWGREDAAHDVGWTVLTVRGTSEQLDPVEPEDEDAAVIAAAPELLRVACDAEKFVQSVGIDSEDAERLVASLRSAIERATIDA